jgi:hypothetical protein
MLVEKALPIFVEAVMLGIRAAWAFCATPNINPKLAVDKTIGAMATFIGKFPSIINGNEFIFFCPFLLILIQFFPVFYGKEVRFIIIKKG